MTPGTRPGFYIFLLLNKLVHRYGKPRAAPGSPRKGSARRAVREHIKGSRGRT